LIFSNKGNRHSGKEKIKVIQNKTKQKQRKEKQRLLIGGGGAKEKIKREKKRKIWKTTLKVDNQAELAKAWRKN